MRPVLETQTDTTLFFQRQILALVLGAHGVQKAFGWFGGFGFDGTLKFFTETLGVPALLAVLIILGETLGALGLVAGAGTRDAAMVALYGMLGVTRANALTASLQILLSYVIVSAIGGVIGMIEPLGKSVRPPAITGESPAARSS